MTKRFHKTTSRFKYWISLTLPTRRLISDQLSSHYSSHSITLLLNFSHVLLHSLSGYWYFIRERSYHSLLMDSIGSTKFILSKFLITRIIVYNNGRVKWNLSRREVNKCFERHSLLQFTFLVSRKLNRALLIGIDRSLNATISIPVFSQAPTVYFDLQPLLRIFQRRRTVKDRKWIVRTFRDREIYIPDGFAVAWFMFIARN